MSYARAERRRFAKAAKKAMAATTAHGRAIAARDLELAPAQPAMSVFERARRAARVIWKKA